MGNETEVPLDPPSMAENMLASGTMFILSFFGLSAYLIVIVALIRRFSSFKNSFYSFLLSLAISDSVMLALFFFYSVPSTVLQSRFLGETADYLFGALCNVVYFAGLMCIMNIAVNRYWAVCRFSTLESVYTKRNVRLLLGFIWLVGIASGIPQLFPCCKLYYWFDGYSWGYDMELWGNQSYIWYDRFMNTLTFGTIIFCYSMILWEQKRKRKVVTAAKDTAAGARARAQEAKRQKAELRLAFQSALVAMVLIAFGLSFTIIPELSLYRWHMYITSILYIINNSVNPFLYLIFNDAIRKAVASLCFGSIVSVTTVGGATTAVGPRTIHVARAPGSHRRAASEAGEKQI